MAGTAELLCSCWMQSTHDTPGEEVTILSVNFE